MNNEDIKKEPRKTKLQRLREEQQVLKKEIKDKIIGYMVAAFGLVAALAWNEAIRSLIDRLFPALGSGVSLKFLYAILLTIFVVVVTVYLLKFSNKDKPKP